LAFTGFKYDKISEYDNDLGNNYITHLIDEPSSQGKDNPAS